MSSLVLAYYSDLLFPSSAAATRQVVRTVEALQLSGVDARLYIPIPWKHRGMETAAREAQLRDYYGLSDRFRTRGIASPLPLIGKLQRFPLAYRSLPLVASEGYDVLCVRNYWHLKMALRRGMTVLYETYKYKSQARRSRAIIELLNRESAFVGMIMHSKLARDYWISQGASPEKVTTIHNGISPAEIASCTRGNGDERVGRAQTRRELQLPEEARIVSYIGNMGKTKGVDSIVELARFLPEVVFLLVGFKAKKDRNRLKRMAAGLGVDNIEMRGWVAPAEVGPYLKASDAVIIPPTDKPLLDSGQTVLPIKTFVYLASGATLLAPRLADTEELLRHEDNAYLLQPDAPQENAHAIRQLLDHPELMARIATSAARTAEEFTWEKRAARILEFAAHRLQSRELNRTAGDPQEER